MMRCRSWLAGAALLAAAPAFATVVQAEEKKPAAQAAANTPSNSPGEGRGDTRDKAVARDQPGSGGGAGSPGSADNANGTRPEAVAETGLPAQDPQDETDPYGVEDLEAVPRQQPSETRTDSLITGPAPLWLGGVILVLALLVSGIVFAILRGEIRRLDDTLARLAKDVKWLEQARANAPAEPTGGGPSQTSARIGGYRTGSTWPDDDPEPLPIRQPKAAPATERREPVPAPPARPAAPAVSLAPLQEELARLIANPAMRTSDYDALLRRYGDAQGYDVTADDGSGRLTPNDGDTGRRLTALVLTGGEFVALLPSARFIREFVLYKERLEAGNDVKALFELEADGSAHLRIERLAYGHAGPGGTVRHVSRGQLGGFLR